MSNFLLETSEKIAETFDIEQPIKSHPGDAYELYAHIPQDFNLSVRVTGNIEGTNMKDTKLISKKVYLHTTGDHAHISARRLRNDECKIKTKDGDIRIGSYIETGVLHLDTQCGNIQIGKKLGINKYGSLRT